MQTNFHLGRGGKQPIQAQKTSRRSFAQSSPYVINSSSTEGGFVKQPYFIAKKSQRSFRFASHIINNNNNPSPAVHQPIPQNRCVAFDCEMVGVGPLKVSVLARVSIVNFNGDCILDAFVQVEEKVTDYRTAVSGVRPEDLVSDKAMSYGKVRSRVKKILSRNILVGHGLQNDLAVLQLYHSVPVQSIRDTSQYLPFMQQWGDGTCRPRRLRDLVWDIFGEVIQSGEHCSIEDARAAMSLYKLVKDQWDGSVAPSYQRASSNVCSTAQRHAGNHRGANWSSNNQCVNKML